MCKFTGYFCNEFFIFFNGNRFHKQLLNSCTANWWKFIRQQTKADEKTVSTKYYPDITSDDSCCNPEEISYLIKLILVQIHVNYKY